VPLRQVLAARAENKPPPKLAEHGIEDGKDLDSLLRMTGQMAPLQQAKKQEADRSAEVKVCTQQGEWLTRVHGLLTTKDYGKAVGECETVVGDRRQSSSAWYLRGVGSWFLGDREETSANFQEAVRLDPSLADAALPYR